MAGETTVWVFNGPKRYPGFPSAVFLDFELAEDWIRRHGASGTLTRYPVNTGVYEWAIARGFFKPKKEEHSAPTFIESFSAAQQEHWHYEQGQRGTGQDRVNGSSLADQFSGSGETAGEMTVWVFNGPKRYPGFPSAVFLDLERAEDWIRRHGTSGTLTRYPVNTGVYEWAVTQGYFKPRKEEYTTPSFIESFSSTRQEHCHYDRGQLAAG